MEVTILDKREVKPHNIEINRSDYAQKDLSKDFKAVIYDVEGLHWKPDKVLQEFIMKQPDFFQDHVIVATVNDESKSTRLSFLRQDEDKYEYYDPGWDRNSDNGFFMTDKVVPLEREKYQKTNSAASKIGLFIVLAIIGALIFIIQRGSL